MTLTVSHHNCYSLPTVNTMTLTLSHYNRYSPTPQEFMRTVTSVDAKWLAEVITVTLRLHH
jgi:hypothetical protein